MRRPPGDKADPKLLARGEELKSIAARVTGATGLQYAGIAAVVSVVVILARMVWVTGAAALSRWRYKSSTGGTNGQRDAIALTPSGAAIVGWCGMRGTVTLAAALALPTGFPFRDLILTTAFGVTLGTLVLQGLTLRPLLLRLQLEDDGAVDREVHLARVTTLRAALAAAASQPGFESSDLVRRNYELQLRRAEAGAVAHKTGRDGDLSPSGAGGSSMEDAGIVRAASDAQRQCLMALRADGTIGDTAFQRVQEELDWMEMGWAQAVGSAETTKPPKT